MHMLVPVYACCTCVLLGSRNAIITTMLTAGLGSVATAAGVLTPTGAKEINALAMAPNDRIAVTASLDRTLKVWSLDDMAYVDTLFGHQSEVMCVAPQRRERAAALSRSRCVSGSVCTHNPTQAPHVPTAPGRRPCTAWRLNNTN